MIIYEINCHSIKNNPMSSAPLPKVMIQHLTQTPSSNWRLNDSTDTAGPFNRTPSLKFYKLPLLHQQFDPLSLPHHYTKIEKGHFHIPSSLSGQRKAHFLDDSGPVAPTLPTPKAPHGWGPLWLWNHVRLLTLSFVVPSLTSWIMVHQYTAAAIKGVPCLHI